MTFPVSLLSQLGLDELADVLARLLRGRRQGTVFPDGDGWVRIEDVALAASRECDGEVVVEQVRAIGLRHRRFEITRTHIRVQRGRPRLIVPDILFAVVPGRAIEAARETGVISPRNGITKLFSDQPCAWLAAHRADEPSAVLVVDAARARRFDVRFLGSKRPGSFTSTPIPVQHILNLREDYGEQHSAGGLPVRLNADGQPEVALVSVTRRSGITWEVAKGKLEIGESPEASAQREIMEETGIRNPMQVIRHIQDIHYGFLAPGNRPRLKTIYLYLLAVDGEIETTTPAISEGIGEVAWFSPEDAAAAVTHASLIPAIARARDLLARYGLTPGPGYPLRPESF